MIDLHCHFLPRIDDGPRTLAESLLLARMAVADGITHTVMTPHIHPGRYENDKLSINKAFQSLKKNLSKEQINLDVTMASEVRISMEILPLIEEDRIPFLGELNGYKVMLLEFPHSHILPGSEKMIDFLLSRHIRPLIAHPERNKDVLRDLKKIEPFVKMGCLLQLTAGSIIGHFGSVAKQRSEEILKAGWAHAIATDAHNCKNRPPVLMAGQKAAADAIGDKLAFDLVDTNPRAIVVHQSVA